MVGRDLWLSLDHVQAGAPDPTLVQRFCERVGVDERPSACVDQDACLLHLFQKALVDDMVRIASTRREYEDEIALASELVGVYLGYRLQPVL